MSSVSAEMRSRASLLDEKGVRREDACWEFVREPSGCDRWRAKKKRERESGRWGEGRWRRQKSMGSGQWAPAPGGPALLLPLAPPQGASSAVLQPVSHWALLLT